MGRGGVKASAGMEIVGWLSALVSSANFLLIQDE